MIDKKLMEQLALAKDAGLKGMSKEFFAPTPGGDEQEEGSPGEEASESPAEAMKEGDPPGGGMAPGGDMQPDASGAGISPEQLQELLRALGIEGGGQ